jgi:hypothetical protein
MTVPSVVVLRDHELYTTSGSSHVNFSLYGTVVHEKKIALPCFCTFVIIPHLKRIWTFIWINLNSFHTRVVCTKFDWNQLDVSF